MTLSRTLRLVTAVAVLTLPATSAGADQRRGGGDRGQGGSRGTAVARPSGRVVVGVPRGGAYPVYRGSIYASHGFYRPYYTFRPRVSIGFGFWAGYSVPYPYYGYGYQYGYPYPYAYPDPYYAYGYPTRSYGYPAPYYPSANYPSANYPSANYPSQNYPSQNYPSANYPSANDPAYGSAAPAYPTRSDQGSVSVQQGVRPASGGVSFEITPGTAAVFVDGTFVGSVAQFGPRSEPLGLTPGRHHIEVRASGYQTMVFEADVTAGQVTPFQGTLQVQRNY